VSLCYKQINSVILQKKIFSSLVPNVTVSTYPCIKTTGPSSGVDISPSPPSQEERDSLPSFSGLDGGVIYSSASRR
jgi:hypothetical protein